MGPACGMGNAVHVGRADEGCVGGSLTGHAYDTQAMWIRFVTFALWLVVGATAVAWIMPWVKPAATPAVGAAVTVAMDTVVPPADWSPLLTRSPAGPAAAPVAADASRFRLLGVAGPLKAQGNQGVALLSIDGKPARAFRPGEAVDGARVVMEVSAHTVKIGVPGAPPSLTLQAPLLPPPATGVPAGFAPPAPS